MSPQGVEPLRCAPPLAYLAGPHKTARAPRQRPIRADQSNGRMAFWKKLLGDDGPRSVDYYQEGTDLLVDGKFHEALTSFRLALKESPGDAIVLQQIAICYTRIGMTVEAAKTYRHVLQKDPGASGAHYGLAFILLRGEHPDESIPHLEAFLANVPDGADAGAHVEHARWTLSQLRAGTHDPSLEPPL